MIDVIENLKKYYNSLLRFTKSVEKELDSKGDAATEQDLEGYRAVCDLLNQIYRTFEERFNHTMTPEEVLEGFKGVK
ncbi:hypothetical protein [Petroclostridium sp. X23]|uniref:hypothetical protein n=1 Tax=Petroclostridium sp. X23 TaxID=3045146 RepID=UPI0024AE83B7|nr:hypothetical protein [Petroclostridium sp. X23]WHH60414.1 hypothetical protein QKW49_06730 [Petroclostridium sp. X23]